MIFINHKNKVSKCDNFHFKYILLWYISYIQCKCLRVMFFKNRNYEHWTAHNRLLKKPVTQQLDAIKLFINITNELEVVKPQLCLPIIEPCTASINTPLQHTFHILLDNRFTGPVNIFSGVIAIRMFYW